MRDDDDRLAPFAVQAMEKLQDLLLAEGIQPRSRLVQNEDLGPADDDARDRYAPLLSA